MIRRDRLPATGLTPDYKRHCVRGTPGEAQCREYAQTTGFPASRISPAGPWSGRWTPTG